jgi:hypothetical protein
MTALKSSIASKKQKSPPIAGEPFVFKLMSELLFGYQQLLPIRSCVRDEYANQQA